MGRWFDKDARYCRPALIFEQLEERIVLDASLDVSSLDTLHDLNVIVASSAWPDIQDLADAARGKAQLVLYDQHDNLAAIEARLEGLAQATGRKIGLVAVMAHGSPGELDLGNEQIDLSTVDAHRSDLRALADDLADNAQIQLYGCSVAENPAGKALVDRIAAYTEADVFASTDATGGKAGNWSLEYASREAATPVPIFDAAALGNVGPLADPESLAPLSSDLYDSTLNKAFVEFNGEIYFSGSDSASGMELRAYNPLTGITRLVTDIIPGSDSGGPLELTVMNGALYFVASDSPSAGGLWRTDGTDLGTELLAEFSKPGGLSALPFANLTAVNNVLFFSANDGVYGWELWSTDGTAAQTAMVADLWAGPDSGDPAVLTNCNGTLFFRAPSVDAYLWTSNGTEAGTVPVSTDVWVRTDSLDLTDWDTFAVLNGEVYFAGEDTAGVYGLELWKSDGTPGGTVMVEDIQTGPGSSSPHFLTPVNGSLFFAANDGTTGEELWITDGLPGGTSQVENIGIDPEGNYPYGLTDVNGTLFFVSYDVALGDTLWTSDGTPAGTSMVTVPNPFYYWAWWVQMTNVNGTANFVLDDAEHGTELWQSDGSTAGTILVQDIWPGSSGSYPIHLTNVNGTLYFFAQTAAGYEPWRYDPASPVNQSPVAGDFAVNATEGVAIPVDGWNFTDPEGDLAQSITVTTLPVNGTLFRDADLDDVADPGESVAPNQIILWDDATVSQLVKYVSDAGYTGPDAVQYLVTDTLGATGTVPGTGNITVAAGVNLPPVAGDFAVNATEGVAIPVDGWNFTDPEGDLAQSITVTTLPVNGTLFRDANLDDVADAGESVGLNQVILWDDATASQLVKYVSAAGYTGPDAVQYLVTDTLGATGTVPGTGNITVAAGVNLPPVAGDFALNATEGVTIPVDGWNFTDPEGDLAQSITVTTLPVNGTLFRDADLDDVADAGESVGLNQVILWDDATASQLVKYVSAAGYTGPDAVQYLVTDVLGATGTVPGTGNITVLAPGNQPPVAGDFALNATQGVATSVDGWNFTDPEGDLAQSITVTTLPVNGTLFRDANLDDVADAGESVGLNQVILWEDATDSRLVKYLSAAGYTGPDAVQYLVTDTLGAIGTVPGTANLTVLAPGNQPPVAGNFALNATQGVATLVDGWNFTDPEGDLAQSITLRTVPPHGTLFRDANFNDVVDAGEPVVLNQVIPWDDATTSQLVKYVSAAGYTGPDMVRYLVTDTQGTTGIRLGAGIITVLAAGNQPPVAGDFALNATEGVAIPVDGWNFTDPEGDLAQSIMVTTLPVNGTLFFDANLDDVVDTGESVELNQVILWDDATASQLVKYVSAAGYTGPDAVQYLVTDTLGATGTVAGTGNVTVSAAGGNLPPVAGDFALNATEGVATPVDGWNFTDPEGDAAQSITVTHLPVNGTLFRDANLDDVVDPGESVTLNQVVSWDDATTSQLVKYRSAAGYTGPDPVQYVVTDVLGATGTFAGTGNITVSAGGNLPPVAGDFAVNATVGVAIPVDGWNFTDPEGDAAQSITVTSVPAQGTLFLDANLDDVVDAGESVGLNQIILWDDATISQLVKYVSDAGYTGPDAVQYVVTDVLGATGTVPGTGSITVGGTVNAPPEIQVPTPQSTVQNTLLILSTGTGNAVSVSDPDAGSAPVQVSLTGINGTLTLAQTTDLIFSAGDGTTDATMTFVGTTDAINAGLNGMSFTPALNYSGTAASVDILADDLGNTGSDGPKTDSDAVAITVVSDPNLPMAGDLLVAVPSSTPTWPWVGWITGWNYTDAQNDAPGSILIASLPTHGTLFLDANGNNLFEAGEEIATGQEIPWSQANSFQGVKYFGDVGYDGVDSFYYAVADASGEVGTFQGTCTIGVGPNDPPVHTLPGEQTLTEDSVLVFSTANGNPISVADPDVGTRPLEVTVYSFYGTVGLGDTSGVTLLTGDGTDDWVVTFRGSTEAVNTALDGLQFTPQANYHGYAAVSIITSDLGASGTGSVRADVDSIPITVTASVDPLEAQDFSATVYEDIVGPVVGWGSTDGDGELPQGITITSLPAHGTLFVDANDNYRLDAGEAVGLNQDISWPDAVTRTKYLGSLNYNGPDTASYLVREAGGSPGTSTGTANITVAAMNDIPENTIPGSQSTAVDTALTFSTTRGNAISVSDPDLGTGELQMQVSSVPGTLSLASTNGLTFLLGDGIGDSVSVFTGHSTDVNTALNGMRFTPDTGFNGNATVSIIANDLGNTGLGGPMADVDTVSITVGSGLS